MSLAELHRIERQVARSSGDLAGYYGKARLLPETVVDSLEDPECGNPIPITTLFGSEVESSSILENLKHYGARVPDAVIPIGDNEFGNLFCLGIKGDDYDQVFFWDHEYEEKVTLVARSFADFLGRLKKET